jgi:MGT family glycosyltransferase
MDTSTPLTGLAVYLQKNGHDVRWYTSGFYADKLQKLMIRHYGFKKALDVRVSNVDEVFPERRAIKNQIKKLSFDLINTFILRGPEYFEDIEEIHENFPFDLVICDCAFVAIPFVKEKLKKPVLSIGVLPLIETSKDLSPMGLGLPPSNLFLGRIKQNLLRLAADKILFGKPNRLISSLLTRHGLKMEGSNVFDMMVRKSTLLLQSGTPGFEYKRSDLGKNIRFIGALLPHGSAKTKEWNHEKLMRYKKVILVTQGTAEKDVSKLLVPTLEAFQNSEYLVVVTTGGTGTEELRKRYAYDNIIIEDFIAFSAVMPFASVYITNGGYGGVMLSITNELPMVVAGVHEGKNEVNARVGYFQLGVNLNTETPTPQQLKFGVERVMRDPVYKTNVKKLGAEFSMFNTNELVAHYIDEVLKSSKFTQAV